MEPLDPKPTDPTLPAGAQPLPSGEDLSMVPADEMISAYLDGELEPQQQRLVEAQLAASPDLRQLLEELQSVRKSLSLLPRLSLDADFAERVLRRAERQMLSEPPSILETTDSSGPAENIVPFVAASSPRAERPSPHSEQLPDAPRRSLRPLLWAAVAVAAVVMIWVTNRGPQLEQAEVAVHLDQADSGNGNGEKSAPTSGTVAAPNSDQLAKRNLQSSQPPVDKFAARIQKDSRKENILADDRASRLQGSEKLGKSSTLDLRLDKENSSSRAASSNSVADALKPNASPTRGSSSDVAGSAGSAASTPASGPVVGSGIGGGMAGAANGSQLGSAYGGPLSFSDSDSDLSALQKQLKSRVSGNSPVLVVKLSITPEAYRSKAFQALLARNELVPETRNDRGLQFDGSARKSDGEAADQTYSRSNTLDRRSDKADIASKVQSSPAEPSAPVLSDDTAAAGADSNSDGSEAKSEKGAGGEAAEPQLAVTAENEKSDVAPPKQKLALNKRGLLKHESSETGRGLEMLLVEGTTDQVQRTLTELKSMPGQFQNIEVTNSLLDSDEAPLASKERLNEPADGLHKSTSASAQTEKFEQADATGKVPPSQPEFADAKPVYETPVRPAAPSSGVQPTAEKTAAGDPQPALDAPAAAAAPSILPPKKKVAVSKTETARSEPTGGRSPAFKSADSESADSSSQDPSEALSTEKKAIQKQRVLFVFSIADAASIGGEENATKSPAKSVKPRAPRSAEPESVLPVPDVLNP
ncbi:MAG: zf-HC2 domain-containing protein [Planctomycetota bacterium]|nr:zf-HC2 domain-containing protein [Planctomycetota bacterium]